jgi:hypothetical protein
MESLKRDRFVALGGLYSVLYCPVPSHSTDLHWTMMTSKSAELTADFLGI